MPSACAYNEYGSGSDCDSEDSYDSASSSSDEEPQQQPTIGSKTKSEVEEPKRVVELPATPADHGLETVRVSYRLCASLNDLKEGKVNASLKLSENARNIFDGLETGRSKNHICAGLKVVEYSHNFPCSLQIDVAGLTGIESAKAFTQAGSRGAFTMRPNGDFADETNGVELTTGNDRAHQSPFLQKYNGWNLNNVDKGITWASDGINALVEKDHPICEYYNASLRAQGQKPIGQQDMLSGTNMFMCKASDVKDCLENLKQGMLTNLKITDLHDVSFNVKRAYGEPDAQTGAIEWDDEEEIYDGLADPANVRGREAALGKKRTLYLTAAFKMRALDG